MNVLSIAIGGASGTILRYFLGKYITFQEFPIATLFINVLGSLFLGFLFTKYAVSNPQLFLALGVGFCGGFTTYSTFSLDVYKLFVAQAYAQASLYLLATLILGIVATGVGVYLGKL